MEIDVQDFFGDELFSAKDAPRVEDDVSSAAAITNTSWQLTHESIPKNPNSMASSVADKIYSVKSSADVFQFIPDARNEDGRILIQAESVTAPAPMGTVSWGDLGLSRPVLKAISQVLKFSQPTPIQCESIPAGISGRDILASAATGSGKTAAFLLPIVERVLASPNVVSRRKDKATGKITGGRAITRAIVLLPTRELAVQCWSMLKALVTFAPVTCALISGGFDSRDQRSDLSKQHDIIISTPGRMLDHLINSPGIHLDHVDMVVLDEADRLLEMGFKDSITEILKLIPKKSITLQRKKNVTGQCQTMLFSATLTAGVKDLASYILSDAVTSRVSDPTKVVSQLVHEFVKIAREDVREASFFSLLESSVHTEDPSTRIGGRVIVFFKEKRESHRLAILAQVLGLSVAELNGNMNQVERLTSMADFQSGRKRYLFATDLAARGLDLPDIELVINYNLPPPTEAETRYIHRVGRSARAGRKGRAITLFTAEEYPIVRRIVKKTVSRDQRHMLFERRVGLGLAEIWQQRIKAVSSIVKEIQKEETVENEIYHASRKLTKAEESTTKRKRDTDSGNAPKKWISTNAPTRFKGSRDNKERKGSSFKKHKSSNQSK